MDVLIPLILMLGLFAGWCAFGAIRKTKKANALAASLPSDAARQFLFFNSEGSKEYALGNIQAALIRKGQALAVLSAKRVINEDDSGLIPYFCQPSYTSGMSKREMEEEFRNAESLLGRRS
jgi:hypothetical protein